MREGDLDYEDNCVRSDCLSGEFNPNIIRVKPCNKVIFAAAPPYARSNVGLQMGQNTQAALSTQVRNSSSKEISNVTIVNFQVKCNII